MTVAATHHAPLSFMLVAFFPAKHGSQSRTDVPTLQTTKRLKHTDQYLILIFWKEPASVLRINLLFPRI